MKNPFSESIVKYPVYHSSDQIFEKFRHTNDIGYHFGTEEAARERAKGIYPEFEIEEDAPSELDRVRVSALSYTGKDPRGMLLNLLVRKLDYPSLPSIRKEISGMNDDEVKDMLTSSDYTRAPDSKSFTDAVKRFSAYSNKFYVISGERRFAGFKKLKNAENALDTYRRMYSRPMPYWIDLRNPLRTEDLGTWSPPSILRALGASAPEKYAILSKIYSPETYRKIRALMRGKGYDGIVYANKVEDKGEDSYIVFSNSQIRKIKPSYSDFKKETDSFIPDPGNL